MEPHAIYILLIDESDDDALFYRRILEKSPLLPTSCSVEHVKTLHEAMELLGKRAFHLIITNLFLSDSQGIATLSELKKTALKMPIVVLSELIDERLALDAISSGAQDYISKSEINIQFFSRVVRFALERHEMQELLYELTFTDDLTHIYNRRGFLTLLEQQAELSKRLGRGFFLFFADLDKFKEINDTFGHPEGDKALAQTAAILKKALRASDIIARFGGDEFAIMAVAASPYDKEKILENIEKTFQEVNAASTFPYDLFLSVGGVYFDIAENPSLDELICRADAALYEVKRQHHLKSTP